MRGSHALVLGVWCWGFSQCVKEGPVLWEDLPGSSFDPTASTTPPVTSSSLTTAPLTSESTVSDASTSRSSSDTGTSTSTDDPPDGTTTPTVGTDSEETTGSDGTATAASDGGSSETSSECVITRGGDGIVLIDDLDDGDATLPSRDGRSGWWYTANDGTSEHFPPGLWRPSDDDAYSGDYAAHFSGSGFLGWGATVGFTLNEECPYDASAYAGITFRARGQGTIRVRFTTVATVPVVLVPGDCVEDCWDDFASEIRLGDAWSEYEITWDDLAQAGWGKPAEFDPAELLAIVWQGGAMSTFDIWLDDIAFVEEGE